MRLVASFEHEGAARVLVHHLKYRGVVDIAELAAEVLVTRLPPVPLVPVPRAISRTLRYGVDPARVIATAVARRLRVPVIHALAPHLHSARRAGRDHARVVRRFRTRRELPPQVVIVDDVVTTGATALAAVASVGVERVRAVAAVNVVAGPSNVFDRVTSPKPGSDGPWQPS